MKPYTEYRDVVVEGMDAAADSASHVVLLVMENMRSDHMKDVAALVDALNDLHMMQHGTGTALVMCPVHPCNTVYDIVKGSRGD